VAAGCLDEPLHWSEKPSLGEGVTIVWSPFVRFETPTGDWINGRIFLLEVHPTNGAPDRVICRGHEILADDQFTPDLVLSRRYVKEQARCQYLLSFGSLECFMRTCEH
jgi:hypothetical protein